MPNKKDKKVDEVYRERNHAIAALAWIAHVGDGPMGGEKAWLARDESHLDPEWGNLVFIDTPVGQMSWHFHDYDRFLFAGLPAGENTWDGHDTLTKYTRLAQWTNPNESPGETDLRLPQRHKADPNEGQRLSSDSNTGIRG